MEAFHAYPLVAAVLVVATVGVRSAWSGSGTCQGSITQAHRGERGRREPDAKPSQRLTARDGLGQSLGQFIEFVAHNFPFVLGFALLVRLSCMCENPSSSRPA